MLILNVLGLHLWCADCLSFSFYSRLFISSSLFISLLRGLHQKVSTCPVCFGFRYNSKVSDYHDFFALSFPFSILFPFPSLALCRRGKKSTILPQTGVILPCLGPLIFNSTVLQVCLCHYFSDLFVLHPASACLLLSQDSNRTSHFSQELFLELVKYSFCTAAFPCSCSGLPGSGG